MSGVRIGFVGAGRLGRPMVERLVAGGHELVVHARQPDARADLEELGVRTTDALDEVAADREVLLICVYDDRQLTEVADPLAAALPDGAVLASHVTGRVSTLSTLAGRYPAIGVVDAPVSGRAADVEAGQLTVLLGGPAAARCSVAAVVRSYADPVLEVGDLGAALAAKLVNNLLLGANLQLVGEAARLGEALGIAPTALLSALEHMSGGSRAGHLASERNSLTEFADVVAPFLLKDVSACRAQADELGVDAGLLLEVVRRGPFTLA